MVDPELGELEFHKYDNAWITVGDREFGSEKAQFVFPGDGGAPTDSQRKRYVEFTKRWGTIRSNVLQVAYEQAKEYFDSWLKCSIREGDKIGAENVPVIANPEDVWRRVLLSSVCVESEGHSDWDVILSIELLYNDGRADDDHRLYIRLRDWNIVYAGIEG